MTDLGRYAGRATVKLTTKGRKSGQPRSVTIWFVVTGPRRVAVQHARAPVAQWYKNLVAHPEVTLDFGDGPLPAKATAIEDRGGIDRVLSDIRKKHWLLGPLIQWAGRNAKPVAANIEVTG